MNIPTVNMMPLGKTAESIAADARRATESAKLRKAAEDFESIFLAYMMKTMRATVPESEMFQGGTSKELFTGMFDQEVARMSSRGRGTGLADMIYKQMTRRHGLSDDDLAFPDILPGESLRIPPTVRSAYRMERLDEIVESAAQQNGLDPALIRAVIDQESSGRVHAVSSKGAKGVMQLMDETARQLGVTDVFDPVQNVNAGVRYLKEMLERYEGDLSLALAAYNAGPVAVDRYGGIPPYDETQRYVSRILSRYESGKNQP